jgi:hypothetical protein
MEQKEKVLNLSLAIHWRRFFIHTEKYNFNCLKIFSLSG